MVKYNSLSVVSYLYENKKYKQITDLYSVVIRIEKENNKPVICKIFMKECAIFSINAYYWNCNSANNCKKITSNIKFYNKEYINMENKTIAKLLVYKLYEDIIKKENMVL